MLNLLHIHCIQAHRGSRGGLRRCHTFLAFPGLCFLPSLRLSQLVSFSLHQNSTRLQPDIKAPWWWWIMLNLLQIHWKALISAHKLNLGICGLASEGSSRWKPPGNSQFMRSSRWEFAGRIHNSLCWNLQKWNPYYGSDPLDLFNGAQCLGPQTRDSLRLLAW